MSYVQLFPTHMLSLESVLGFCHGIAKGGDCKVKFLSTILLALFRAKFGYISAISNPVFRWDSCKGSEWDSVKKCSRVCKKNKDSRLDAAYVPGMPEVEASRQLEHYMTK